MGHRGFFIKQIKPSPIYEAAQPLVSISSITVALRFVHLHCPKKNNEDLAGLRENSSSSGCRRLWSAPTHYITVSGQLHPSSVNVPARPTDGQLSGQRIHDLDLFTVVKPSGFNQQIGFLLFAQTFLHPPLVLCMCVSAKGVYYQH